MTTDTLHEQKTLILDFGSQYTQNIARKVRECQVYCEIHPFQAVDDTFLDTFAPKAIILSGGPASVIDPNAPRRCSCWCQDVVTVTQPKPS